MVAAPERQVSVHVSIVSYERLFWNPIALNMSDSGALHGDIYSWHIEIGDVEGKFFPSGDVIGRVTTTPFNVGSVSSQFSQISGNETWTARKI